MKCGRVPKTPRQIQLSSVLAQSDWPPEFADTYAAAVANRRFEQLPKPIALLAAAVAEEVDLRMKRTQGGVAALAEERAIEERANNPNTPPSKLKTAIVALLMLGLGVGGSWFMINSYAENEALSKRGVNSTGTTSGASTRTKRGNTSYWIDVTYTVGGRTFRHGDSVTKKVFDKYSSNYFYSPQSIPIRYLPDTPDVVQIADPDLPNDHHTPSPWLWILLLLWIGYGGLALCSCFPDGWRTRIRASFTGALAATRKKMPAISLPSLTKQIPPTTLLADLKQLRDTGVITEAEFVAKKAELLKRI